MKDVQTRRVFLVRPRPVIERVIPSPNGPAYGNLTQEYYLYFSRTVSGDVRRKSTPVDGTVELCRVSIQIR
jgi:hypothetical protein